MVDQELKNTVEIFLNLIAIILLCQNGVIVVKYLCEYVVTSNSSSYIDFLAEWTFSFF